MEIYLKFKYEILGGHTHVAVFINNNGWDYTFAKSGDLVFDNDQFEEFQKQMIPLTNAVCIEVRL